MAFFILTKKRKNVCAVTVHMHVPLSISIGKGRDGHIPTLFGANFSEAAFLHPVVKLTN